VADRVHPLGGISEEEKVRLLNWAEVFLFPSRREGFGMAAAEAMACGTPVVAARAGGLPEVVEDGKTGFLCDPEDAEAFATAVDRLLKDPALARRMGEAGRRRVLERFSWESAGARILEIYERAAAERPRRR
jgi:glycosyltransferase involved in cell wall biosynthesis